MVASSLNYVPISECCSLGILVFVYNLEAIRYRILVNVVHDLMQVAV